MFAVIDECTLRFLERAQYGLFVQRLRFARDRFGTAQSRARTAETKARPREGRRDGPRSRVFLAEDTPAAGETGNPEMEMRGKRSAAATPSPAVAAARRRSAARMSGRRRRNVSASPIGKAFASGGYARGERSTSSSPGR